MPSYTKILPCMSLVPLVPQKRVVLEWPKWLHYLPQGTVSREICRHRRYYHEQGFITMPLKTLLQSAMSLAQRCTSSPCLHQWPLQLAAAGICPQASTPILASHLKTAHDWCFAALCLLGTFYSIKAPPEARCSVLVGTSFFKNKHFWADAIFIQFSLWNFQRQIFAWQCHSRVWGRNCHPSVSVYICACTQETYSGSTTDTAKLNIHRLGNCFTKSHLQAHSNSSYIITRAFSRGHLCFGGFCWTWSGMESGVCVVESSSL